MKYSELFRLLKKDGWYEVRQSGSHVIMKHPAKTQQITVPFHACRQRSKERFVKCFIKTSRD